MTRVRDLMHTGILTCAPETTLGEAAVLLNRHRVHALVVAAVDGEPLGVLSDLDLLAGEWLSTDPASLEAMRRITAGEMMSKPPLTIDADVSAADAIQAIKANEVHRLLVLDRGKLVGVISVGDLVLSLAHLPTRRETVADVMSRGIVACGVDTTLAQAARAMTERRSRSLVVVGATGSPRGIVTGWDLLGADAAVDKTVADLMKPPISIGPNATLRDAADTMIAHHIHRLLVIDPARPDSFPLGVISTADIIAEMAEPGSVWQK